MNDCSKCTDGFIRLVHEGKVIVVPCDWCSGYGEHEDVAK